MGSRPSPRWLVLVMVIPMLGAQGRPAPPALNDQLLVAVAKGDAANVASLLARGADVNAGSDLWVTALQSAADRANVAVVKLLLEHGADTEVPDLEWGKTALRVAAVPWSDVKDDAARAAIVTLLVEKGAGSEGEALPDLIRAGHVEAVRTIVGRGKVESAYLNQALGAARRARHTELTDLLTRMGAKDPGPSDSARSPERLKAMAGVYRSGAGQQLTLGPGLHEDELLLERSGKPRLTLLPVELTLFRSQDSHVVVRMASATLPPGELKLHDNGRSEVFTRAGDASTSPGPARTERRATPGAPVPSTETFQLKVGEWPSFRGPHGAGVADGAQLPTTWDAEKDVNIKWKVPIPGLAHSSPVIWGNRVFVTTAAPANNDTMTFRHGGAFQGGGAVASTKDDTPHSWRVYALDKATGKILWQRVASEGVPRTERHVMQSQADATPATDGTHLVVSFGSEGVYCYDVDGKLLWKRDLGALDSGYVVDPSYEWATASSPIIYKNLVILQVDLLENSYIAALDIKSGKDVWRTKRDEVPSWATPLLYEGPPRAELVTVATNFARGYDPNTGKELWRFGKHSTFATPTPIAGFGLIYMTSGSGGTIQPIYAIRPGGQGDITLGDDEASNEFVVWSQNRGGSFTPTPTLYGNLLYVSSTSGVLAAYNAHTGERVYQERLAPGSYSASGVAADGKLYFASEDGEVTVVRAGPKFERLAVNKMGEVLMATPAIAPGMMIIRMQHHVVAVADATPTR